MKRLLLVGLPILVLAAAGAWWLPKSPAGPGGKTAPEGKHWYTCGMHPQVVKDQPGNCPICGMKLTLMKRTGPAVKSNLDEKPGEASPAEDSSIAIDPVTIQNMGIRTETVIRGPLRRLIRTVGVVDFNEAGIADVSPKFRGWVEKLYVDTTGQQVHRGDPLFEIYSPELYSAEAEYLLSRATTPNAPGAGDLQSSARQKLRFWDISEAQIVELEKGGQPKKTLQVQAPIDGFVTEKGVVEGQMVEAGMRIYRIADLSLVWVQGEIYEQDLPYIQLGQEAVVTLPFFADRKFRGRVTYIYPYLDPKTRTARLRMEFHNPGFFLKPGMFASVEVQSELSPSALLVPDDAVLRSGQRNTVFVALDGGKFDPREVVLGPRSENDLYQVLGGLKEGERVVTSGQFMLDSESQLREAIQKMREPASSTAEAMTPQEPNRSASTNQPSILNPIVYVCPMPEHVSIEYAHPGKCPICGMSLVPVNKGTLKRMTPGGKVLYYTCPMPEHADLRENKPGHCPKCGMTLIPIMTPQPTD